MGLEAVTPLAPPNLVDISTLTCLIQDPQPWPGKFLYFFILSDIWTRLNIGFISGASVWNPELIGAPLLYQLSLMGGKEAGAEVKGFPTW